MGDPRVPEYIRSEVFIDSRSFCSDHECLIQGCPGWGNQEFTQKNKVIIWWFARIITFPLDQVFTGHDLFDISVLSGFKIDIDDNFGSVILEIIPDHLADLTDSISLLIEGWEKGLFPAGSAGIHHQWNISDWQNIIRSISGSSSGNLDFILFLLWQREIFILIESTVKSLEDTDIISNCFRSKLFFPAGKFRIKFGNGGVKITKDFYVNGPINLRRPTRTKTIFWSLFPPIFLEVCESVMYFMIKSASCFVICSDLRAFWIERSG